MKSEVKKEINNVFGFDMKKIEILEYGGINVFDKHSYIMFRVCGIDYQMHWDTMTDKYTLRVYDDGLTKDIV